MTPEQARQQAKEIALAHTEGAVELYDLSHGGSSPLADAIAAALLSAAGEWMTMESAPNEGHILVIGGPHDHPTIRPADGDFWRREKVGPTHWRPLPPPPHPAE